jgi:hypothetical protein
VNSILVIHPYKYQGMWVFDDPKVGLVQEPFVAGADVILDRMAEGIAGADAGMTVLFSAQPFPGHQFRFDWRREESGGNWYYSPDFEIEGWLCPALFKYFERAPQTIYAQVKPRPVQ